jgi:hypothetical protein
MLGIFGVIFILAGGATLAVSTTMFGQISGLILWLIAALFIELLIRRSQGSSPGRGHPPFDPRYPAAPHQDG